MKLIIGIPTINRADLLNEALANYFEDFKDTEIVICDNGKQDIITRERNFVLYRPEQNLGVSIYLY
jgi:glycosyltransferase involved in cell wall biosynthesis